MINFTTLMFASTPISLCVVAVALSMLFSKAFESASRNTESIKFIQSQLLIAASLIELSSILIIGLFVMVLTKLGDISITI